MNDLGNMLAAVAASELFRLLLLAFILGVCLGFVGVGAFHYFYH